jgi:hypothetical protein
LETHQSKKQSSIQIGRKAVSSIENSLPILLKKKRHKYSTKVVLFRAKCVLIFLNAELGLSTDGSYL